MQSHQWRFKCHRHDGNLQRGSPKFQIGNTKETWMDGFCSRERNRAEFWGRDARGPQYIPADETPEDQVTRFARIRDSWERKRAAHRRKF
eukprot:2584714-Amphidinium_carterae.2